MGASRMISFKKSRSFCLLLILCCAVLFSLSAETEAANAAPKGVTVVEFTRVDFPNNPQCWKFAIPSGTAVSYTNNCYSNVLVDVLVTHVDGTQESFVIASKGEVIFMGGNPNLLHIIKGEID